MEIVVAMLFRVTVCRYWGKGRDQPRRSGSSLKLMLVCVAHVEPSL